MKTYGFFILVIFLVVSIRLSAQPTIELEGLLVDLSQLSPYRPFEVDTALFNKSPVLKSAEYNGGRKMINHSIYTSKGFKRFASSTFFKPINEYSGELPSSSLKFFDEKGLLKWKKNFEAKAPLYCFISSEGKYLMVDMAVIRSNEPETGENSLIIFDDQGKTVLDYSHPVKYRISSTRDNICYQEDSKFTNNPEANKSFYCFDLKSETGWNKKFEKDTEVRPVSLNGDFIIAYSDSTYTLFKRNGDFVFKKSLVEFPDGINAISNDGKYALATGYSKTEEGYVDIFNLKKMTRIRIKYLKLVETKYSIFNGGNFINNSYYLVALTSIIAPNTAMIVIYDNKGNYLGHEKYYDIQSSFWNPIVTLLDDGSFEVFMDGYFLGNLMLPRTNTLKYLKK